MLQYNREREIEISHSIEGNQLPQPQLGKMLALRNETEQLIRAVLDPEQRARYDRDSRPLGRTPTVVDKR